MVKSTNTARVRKSTNRFSCRFARMASASSAALGPWGLGNTVNTLGCSYSTLVVGESTRGSSPRPPPSSHHVSPVIMFGYLIHTHNTHTRTNTNTHRLHVTTAKLAQLRERRCTHPNSRAPTGGELYVSSKHTHDGSACWKAGGVGHSTAVLMVRTCPRRIPPTMRPWPMMELQGHDHTQ